MNFPDQSHINRVRDALHQRSGNGASVMVGSGFSRNAIPLRPNAEPLPTWQGVTNRLHEALYPGGSLKNAEGNLRIAQEYEAAFGRSALHDELQRLVRDRDFSPGQAHTRLLRLDWDNIFTTNWDTLLERARSSTHDQNYDVVSSMEQIPMTRRPRIVKLHGSLPSQFPLIITEEDYRIYPRKFAPFVNTVQQAMMENVFLLIGFSGEDPNFVNWSGWVRDNLGASAPKIYLAGYLELSPHRRRMLESQNIVPIDLAQHPQANLWPERLRHHHATEWLLHTLEHGKPYDVTDWPELPNQQPVEIPNILQPIDKARSMFPKSEPHAPAPEEEISAKQLTEVIEIWRYNRLMYPGWLTIPSSIRRKINYETDAWGRQMLHALPNLTIIERLAAIRELLWREEILVVPMLPHFESAIETTLSLIDCNARTIDGEPDHEVEWAEVREGWRDVAVTLVTAARFRFDRASFEKWVNALTAFQDEDIDIRQRIHHEKCLWSIYDFDFTSLSGLLTDWQTEDCDPVWMMRKSALLWEVGRDEEAEELLQHAIDAIRAMPEDELSLAGSSREAWATLVALGWYNRQRLSKRLRELAAVRCDVFEERQLVLDALDRNKSEDAPPAFDVNRRRGERISFSNYDPQSASYRAIRLSEIVGIPPSATEQLDGGRMPKTVWCDALEKAADELANLNLQFAVRLVLRTSWSGSNNTLQRVLTRTRLAILSTDHADSLAAACLRIIENELIHPIHGTGHSRIEAAIEVLSRLVTRVSPDLAEIILDRALEFCRNDQLQRRTGASAVGNLLRRSWEALPRNYRSRRVLELLNSPIAGLDGQSPLMEHIWPDPVEPFARERGDLRRTFENEDQWKDAIDLVVRGPIWESGRPAQGIN